MSKYSFKEDRALPSKFLSQSAKVEQAPGIFTIQHEYATYKFDDSFPYHYHDWYELYYLHHGSGIFRIKNREYKTNDGVWLFAPQGTEHKMIYTSDTHERTLIYFSREYISPSIFPHFCKLLSPVYITIKDTAEKMQALLQKLQTEFNCPDEFSSELYKTLLFEILTYLVRNTSAVSSDEPEQNLFINHVIDYIDIHFSEQIRLEDLAEINDMSVSHLSKKFKSVTGMNFSHYLNFIRIWHAKKMLTETSLPISEISERCGFNDSNYFSYVFKNSEGISPISFRKSIQL